MTKKVFVTGATGFIGRHALAPLIERGFEVHAAYHKGSFEAKNVQWHHADLLRDEAAQRLCRTIQPTHLLHFAWYAVPGKYWTSEENEKWVIATDNLLRAFAASAGTRAVLAGTCAEYDWKNLAELVSEPAPIAPATLYGACKHRAHERAESFAKDTGVSLAWGRIFFLYGPHEPRERLVASVINSLLEENEANTSSGEQVRDFLHVQDVASAFAALLDSDVQGAVNIASGNPVQLKDIVREIADIVGKPQLVRLGALPSRPNEPPRLVADTKRLANEVGWRPRYSLREGLEKTIEWWEARRN